MDGSNGNDVSVLLSVEVVEVRSVLEVVCDAGTVLNNGVGDNIIVVGLDVKGNVLLGEDLLCDLKDLCVGCGRCRDGDGAALQRCVINAAVKTVGGVINSGNDAACILLVDEVCDLLAL